MPPSRSSISRDNDTPQVQNPISTVADTIVGAADEVVEGLGDLITPTAQDDDYAETAWQRKLRNQANRKKKRGRGLNYKSRSSVTQVTFFIPIIKCCFEWIL